MSALACGCDDSVGWTCDKHHQEKLKMQQLKDQAMAALSKPISGHRATSEPRVQRFIERLDADGMVHLVSPLDESLVDAHRLVDQLRGTLTEVAHRAEAVQTAEQANRHALVTAYAQVEEFQRDIRRIGSALATFYRAPLSMSSVQPLLTLAEELNPELRNDPRRI